MKIPLSKGSIAKIALLMLLSLSAFAGMTVLVNAAATKDPNISIIGSGYIELTWKSKKSETYGTNDAPVYANFGGLDYITIIPTHGWHIEVLLTDGIDRSTDILDEDGFSLSDGLPKRAVSVTFVENNGVDDVDEGSDVEAYPDPGVGLIFVNVVGEGWVYADTIELQEPSQILSEGYWKITTTAIFDPGVTVMLVLNLQDVLAAGRIPEEVRLVKTEYELARSDVNWDGIVDGDDVSDVANFNPSEYPLLPGDPRLRYDINDDLKIDDEDVNIVNNYNGQSVWVDITLGIPVVEDGFVYVYGVTDDLSIFDCI